MPIDDDILRRGLVRPVEDERLVRALGDDDAIEAALRAATHQVQVQAVLAKDYPPAVAHVRVAHRHEPSKALGGDNALPSEIL